MMLYGFLHTEAIMDVADALYAAHSGKDAYTIIKEPTVGAMGVLWAGCMVLMKVAGITYLLLHGEYALFLSILLISRLGLLLLFFTKKFSSTFITKMQE
jgi:adenosylcobinamide-GDP ribazoletransferase